MKGSPALQIVRIATILCLSATLAQAEEMSGPVPIFSGDDGRVWVYDQQGVLVTSIEGSAQPIVEMVVDAESGTVFAVANDQTVRAWRPSEGDFRQLTEFVAGGDGNPVHDLALHPSLSEVTLAIGGSGPSVWETRMGGHDRIIRDHPIRG